jgi:hypothetical protein
LTPEDLTFWQSEIERAETLRTDTIAAWDSVGNLNRYTPKTVMSAADVVDAQVNVAKDFSDVERKKAALFYDTPRIALVPDDGTPPPPLLLFQEFLNQILGPKRMRTKHMALKAIQDGLVAIQPSPTEIGYTQVSELVPVPQDSIALWKNTAQGTAAGVNSSGDEQKPVSLWWYVMLAVLLLALAESLLGNQHLSVDKEAAV